MFVAAGLGFVDLVEDNVFAPNDLIRHMEAVLLGTTWGASLVSYTQLWTRRTLVLIRTET